MGSTLFFAVLTNFVVSGYGSLGINIFSLIVGVTDIDPYILNLFQVGNINISSETIVRVTIIATANNNLIKIIYSLFLGSTAIRKTVIIGFSIFIIISICLAIIV